MIYRGKFLIYIIPSKLDYRLKSQLTSIENTKLTYVQRKEDTI